MIQLTREEAVKLVRQGRAGWWAIDANPPIPHRTHVVMQTRYGAFYLCEADELSVVLRGVTILDGIPKVVHAVTATGIRTEVLKAEAADCRPIRVQGGTVPALYGGRRRSP